MNTPNAPQTDGSETQAGKPLEHARGNTQARPLHGVGIGLRAEHSRQILHQDPAIDWTAIDWLELLADNHLAEGGASYTR